jgi:hypothetical protein
MKKTLFLSLIILITVSCSNSLSDKERKEYTLKGKEIAEATAKNLVTNLSQKMKSGGVTEAVPFCNTMAYPLTEEIEKKYDVSVKRTSLSIRNNKNSPTEGELIILNQYKNSFINNDTLKPIVNLDNTGKPHFYAPILLQKKCMTCHGTVGQEVTIQTDSIIRSYYPDDNATGFKEGDLRGIWSITFNK